MEYQDSTSNFFCLKLLKFSAGESSIVALISGTQKVWKGGGLGVSRCSVESFLSHTAENFRRVTLYRFTSFGYRKNLCFGGLCHDIRFSVEFFCLTVPKIFAGNPSVLCFRKLPVAKKFMDNRGGVSRFSVESFCLILPKISGGESSIVALISGTEKVWR